MIHAHFDWEISIGRPFHPGPPVETNIGKSEDIFQSEVEMASFSSGAAVNDDLFFPHDSRFCKEFFQILFLLPGPYFFPFQGRLPKNIPSAWDMTSTNLFAFFAAILLRWPGIHNHNISCREVDPEPIAFRPNSRG